MMVGTWRTCIHCCTPLCQFNKDEEATQRSSSSITTNFVTKALSSVFKLNFLKAFETLEWDPIEEEEDEQSTLMCINCSDTLTNLYQLYNDFLQLGQIDSALSQKLGRLDEIIDSHEQKSIHCDLLLVTTKSQEGIEDSFDNSVQPKSSSSTNFFPKELKIVLTRLPENNLRRRRTTTTIATTTGPSTQEDDYFNDYSPSNHTEEDDDDDYNPESSEIKTENYKEDDELPDISTKSVKDVLQSEEEDEMPLTRRSKKTKKRKVSEKTTTKRLKKSTTSSSKKSIKSSSSSRRRTKEPKRNKPSNHKTKIHRRRGGMNATKYFALKSRFANPCWYCKQKDFATPADCVEHTKKEHLKFNSNKNNDDLDDNSSGPNQVCPRCSKITRSGHSFIVHQKWCESVPSGVIMPKEFQCQVCSKCFITHIALRYHMGYHSTGKPYACDRCDFRTNGLSSLGNHKKYQHSVVESRIKCDECNAFLKNEHTLRIHKKAMHTTEGHKIYRAKQEAHLARCREKNKAKAGTFATFCVDCQIDLYSRLGLINHRRNFHGDTMGSEFTCDTCGKNFTYKRTLKEHLSVVHSDARPYMCEGCGKSFKTHQALNAHVQHTHSEEGRLKYNEKIREFNRRKKLLNSQLASVAVQNNDMGDC